MNRNKFRKRGLCFILQSSALLLWFNTRPAAADATWVYAVQISATVQTSPPSITLHWEPDDYGADTYTIYRKLVEEIAWKQAVLLSGAASNWLDTNVVIGGTYEYKIVKAATLGYTGYGYIYAGINAPLIESRGKVVLVLDKTWTDLLSNELNRLQMDLTGDGWTVLRHEVAPGDAPAFVRSLIVSDYQSDPAHVNAVFLFGHVPVFRCGSLNVDHHGPRSAPCDAYYGDMDGVWDQTTSYLPSDVELMVGRVDMFDMPGLEAPAPWPSEVELLRNYLNKDHKWRHKRIAVPSLALVGNRFGDQSGEAMAASGFRNFEPLAGPGNIVQANETDAAPPEQRWSSMLAVGTYLWAYGCGGGDFTTMSGMGTHGEYFDLWSSDLVSQDAKAVFVMMFGSWFWDWAASDDLMRAVLATPSMGLTCSWSGRPHWFYHHMGLGQPIGYSARITMNNSTLYQNQTNAFTRGVHIALLGDPTLRMHPVAPPSGLVVVSCQGTTFLKWSPSSEDVLGYHVYRRASASGPFMRLTRSLISETMFNDLDPPENPCCYMVRAVKLQSSPSGTYFNPSQGVSATTESASVTLNVQALLIANGCTISWNSQNGQVYRVQATSAVGLAQWEDVGTIIASGLSTCWTEPPSATSNRQRFYRVIAIGQ